MKNVKLVISYDGSRYFGWQKTCLERPSIEGELEKAAFQILGRKVQFEAASRTDRGVHAKGQTAHFLIDEEIDLKKLLRSFNAVLPRDISLLSCEFAHDDFHPTLDALAKEYHYLICTSVAQLPIHRLYSWHTLKPLNLAAMREAAYFLIGTHDFSAFTNERTLDAVRTLKKLSVVLLEGRLRIELEGNRFLYKMARNIAGTLVSIGCGKISDTIPSILASKDRRKAGVTAPAHGLFLMKVFYDLSK